MDPQLDLLVVKYKKFKQDPLYFVRKYPEQTLLVRRGKKLKYVVMASDLYDNVMGKLKIDWSKK